MADILIVDTQAALRQQLVKLMQDMGHRAMVVATIAEASRILQEAPPDLVATDVTLTDGSSTGLVQQAIALGVSTLMMTGNPDRIVEFDGAGRPYLSKPFTPELCKGSMKYSGRRMTFSVRASVAKRGSSSPPCAARALKACRPREIASGRIILPAWALIGTIPPRCA